MTDNDSGTHSIVGVVFVLYSGRRPIPDDGRRYLNLWYKRTLIGKKIIYHSDVIGEVWRYLYIWYKAVRYILASYKCSSLIKLNSGLPNHYTRKTMIANNKMVLWNISESGASEGKFPAFNSTILFKSNFESNTNCNIKMCLALFSETNGQFLPLVI